MTSTCNTLSTLPGTINIQQTLSTNVIWAELEQICHGPLGNELQLVEYNFSSSLWGFLDPFTTLGKSHVLNRVLAKVS